MMDFGDRSYLTSSPIKCTWRDVVAAMVTGLVCGALIALAI